MYSPDDPSYEPPSFTPLMPMPQTVADGDTVSADTVRITISGNDEKRLLF
jgi:hypothetical protein